MLGIIGGVGLASLTNLMVTKRQIVRTPYGEPSQPLLFGHLSGHEIVFLARHGIEQNIPPHAINYRANIWALQAVGVTDLVAVSTVGCIDNHLSPHDIIVPHQLIDYTYSRASSYYDGVTTPVRHIDFTHPYSAALRTTCTLAAENLGMAVHKTGVYAVVQGPRFETLAEVERLARDGATMVGMTGMPEAVLARELNINYAVLCVATHYAAGCGNMLGIDTVGIGQVLDVVIPKIRALLAEIIMIKMCVTQYDD